MLVRAPQKKSKNRIERRLAEKKQIYDSVLEIAQEETKLKLNEQIWHLRNELKDFVIDFEDSANLTFDIGQIANDKKVGSFSIKTKDNAGGSAVADCNYIYEDNIDVSFTAADFNQFAGFLNAMERHRPVVFVDKFEITRSDRDDSGHQVSMRLSVFVKKRRDS
jgi:hypothetical protein